MLCGIVDGSVGKVKKNVGKRERWWDVWCLKKEVNNPS